MDLTKLYKKQISFTEWFEEIDHQQTEEMRKEDNEKRDRLQLMNNLIGLPFDRPKKFLATQLTNDNLEFQNYLQEHGHELCALRLVPLNPKLPKLRMRGHTVKDVMQWYAEQNINPEMYKAEFVPHASDYQWSTIFVVNNQGIFGEIIKGGHYQLSQGFYEENKPITFSYNFNEWDLSTENQEALQHLKEITQHITLNQEKQQLLQQLQSTFTNDTLKGYFETTTSLSNGLWFVDYNRVLGNFYKQFAPTPNKNEDSFLTGQGANPGTAQGKIRIVNSPQDYFEAGEILVCNMTTPEFLPLMKKAKAIITNLGGILSHAAIVSRELGIPCLTGTSKATELLKNGDEIEVDAGKGTAILLTN